VARVLIADSCELGRRYAREVLQYGGHRVLEAEDFESLVATLLAVDLDVVLLDPGLEGTDRSALERFLARRGPGAPRVFLVAEGEPRSLEHLAEELGAEGAHVKGSDAAALLRAIDVVLQDPRPPTSPGSVDPWAETAPPRRPWDQRL